MKTYIIWVYNRTITRDDVYKDMKFVSENLKILYVLDSNSTINKFKLPNRIGVIYV